MFIIYKIWDLRLTFSKINTFSIITEHVRTLKRSDSNYISYRDIFTFFVFPAIISYLVLLKGLFPGKDIINILIAALAIFAGFLFNLLAIVFGLTDKLKINAELSSSDLIKNLKEKILKEVHSNISYNILLSVLSIVTLLVCLYDFGVSETKILNGNIIIKHKDLAHFISYYFLISFLLTLLMVLKRVHILMKKEF